MQQEEPTAWTGWVAFAGIMMIVLGVFNALDGLVALLNGSWLVDNTQLPVTINYTAWGWTWVIVGTIVAVAGFGVLAGQTWARVAGIIMAALNAMAQLMFIPAYPIWSILIITIDIIVIWSLTAHGREMAQ